jgi:hypothetical protein
MFTSVVLAMLIQSAGASQRQEFVACLKQAASSAQTEKVGADAFGPYARQKCGAIEGSFKGALIAFDVKNKVSRKQASSDADAQIDDYFGSALDRYKSMVGAQ